MAKALFVDPVKKVVLEEVELGATPANHVRVRMAYSYVSAGTELTQLQMGSRPNIKAEVKRGQIGYSLSGVVAETGEEVSHVKAGDRVACVGQGAFHATEVLVPKNLVIAIPPEVSLRAAAPGAMMCFALEGIRKGRLEFGENVLVVGGGLMGQIASQFAYYSGAEVMLVDKNKNRLQKVRPGIKAVFGDEQGWKTIAQRTVPVGVEAVFMCLGGEATAVFNQVKAVMCQSPDNIAQGRIVFSGGATITASLASPSGNLQILSSAKAGPGYRDAEYEQGADYPQYYVKWTVTRNVATALRAIADKKLDIESFITHEYPLSAALAAYEKLAEPDTDALCVLFEGE